MDKLSNGRRTLDERMKAHPYATLGAALGIGYVLGGGLFTRLTARLLKVAVAAGAPLALGPLLEKELLDLARVRGAERAARAAQVPSPATISDAGADGARPQ